MSGRLQKVAAAIAVLSAFASHARADGPIGLSGLLPGERAPLPASLGVSTLGFGGASEDARWSFSASAGHDPWEAGAPGAAARFAARDALDGGATRAAIALDLQRAFGASRLNASAFAARRYLGVHSIEGMAAEHLQQRDQRGSTGVDVLLGHGPFRAALRFREETLDADARLFGMHARALGTLREDRLRHATTGLDLRHHQRAGPFEAILGMSLDDYRYDVRSDLPGRTGAATGLLVAPSLALHATLARRTRLFARAGRGDDDVAAAVAVDPRAHAPLGMLDPAADALHVTAGVSHAWGAGLETRFALSRTRTAREIRLTESLSAERTDRAAQRDALHASARWHALPALTFDADATWLSATYRDGAREAVPDAAVRHATAGATLRPSRGWSASLFVSHFATKDATDDEGERLRSSTLVNARLTHHLSRKTRVSLDVFNVFAQSIGAIDYHAASRLWGRPGMADDFLFHPAEPRGFRVRLRTTF